MSTQARLPKPGRHRLTHRQASTATRLIARMERIQAAACRGKISANEDDRRTHALWLAVDKADPAVAAEVMRVLDLRIAEAIEDLAS